MEENNDDNGGVDGGEEEDLTIPGLEGLQGLDFEDFLSSLQEVIGPDANQIELFREFAQSHSFSELLELAQSQSIPQGAEPDGPEEVSEQPGIVDENPTTEEVSEPKPISLPTDLKTPQNEAEKENQELQKTSQDSETISVPKPRAPPIQSKPGPIIQTDQNEVIPGSFEDIIKVMDIVPKHTKPKKKSTGQGLADGKIKSGNNSKNPQPSTSQGIDKQKSEKDKKKKSTTIKIKLPILEGDLKKYKHRYNLKLCSVILCDIIKLGDEFKSLKSKRTTEAHKPIRLNRAKIKEIYKEEESKRKRFRKKLRVERCNQRSESRYRTEERNRLDTNKRRKSQDDGKKAGSIASNDVKEVEVKKRKEKVEQFSAGGTRILPFEKRATDDRNRIRRPKMKETKVEKPSKESKANQLAELERKQKLENSFRIPKKKDATRFHIDINRSRHEAAEIMKFERRREFERQVAMQAEIDANINEPEFIPVKAAPVNGSDLPDDYSGIGGDDRDDDDDDASPPPPITDVRAGAVALGATKFYGPGITPEDLLLLDEGYEKISLTEATARKIAWWFLRNDKDTTSPDPYNAEQQDIALFQVAQNPACDNASQTSSPVGNVSDPGGVTHEDLQSNIVSSSDSQVPKDYTGCALLKAKYRTSTEGDFKDIFQLPPRINYEKENFEATCNLCKELIVGKRNLAIHVVSAHHRDNLLDLSRGIVVTSSMPNNDTREESQSFTSIPSDSMKQSSKDGRRSEGVKIKKEKSNGTSNPDVVERVARDPNMSKSNMSVSGASSIRSGGSTVPPGVDKPPSRPRSRPDRRRSRTPKRRSRSPRKRSRSKSPRHKRQSGHRTRSRSPRPSHRRTRSRSPLARRNPRTSQPALPQSRPIIVDPVEEFLERTNRPRRSPLKSPSHSHGSSKRLKRSRSRSKTPKIPELKRKANQIFNVKLALTAEGKWTPNLETKFGRMEVEEAKLVREFEEMRKTLADSPEEHPLYAEEWMKFWENKHLEVENSGGDAETYDYIPEWKQFWTKRVEILFDVDFDAKLDKIRLKYGMDYDSLNKLRSSDVQTAVPTPPPAPPSRPPSERKAKSVNSRSGEDFTAKSMSISDGNSTPGNSVGKKRGSTVAATPAVTVDQVKSIWEMMTGTKMTSQPNKADVSSIVSGGSATEGTDLVQILHLMQGLEDQLSLLAPQVKSYFVKAEAMELAKRGTSDILLEDVEFVHLLFRSRDKFNGLIKAGVVSQDVMRKLNLTVYNLNLVLDSPQCQKMRPKNEEPTVVETETVRANIVLPDLLPVSEDIPAQKMLDCRRPINKLSPVLEKLIADFDDNQKAELAEELSRHLGAIGYLNITDQDLEFYIIQTLENIYGKEPRTSTDIDPCANLTLPTAAPPAALRSQPPRPPEPALLTSPPECPSVPETGRIEWVYGSDNVTVQRTMGTAFPKMPEFNARAVSPPPPPQENYFHQQESNRSYSSMGETFQRRPHGSRGPPEMKPNFSSGPASQNQGNNPGFQGLEASLATQNQDSPILSGQSPLLEENPNANAAEEVEASLVPETVRPVSSIKTENVTDMCSKTSDSLELPDTLPRGIRDLIIKERMTEEAAKSNPLAINSSEKGEFSRETEGKEKSKVDFEEIPVGKVRNISCKLSSLTTPEPLAENQPTSPNIFSKLLKLPLPSFEFGTQAGTTTQLEVSSQPLLFNLGLIKETAKETEKPEPEENELWPIVNLHNSQSRPTLPFTLDDASSISSNSNDLPNLPPGIKEMIKKDHKRPPLPPTISNKRPSLPSTSARERKYVKSDNDSVYSGLSARNRRNKRHGIKEPVRKRRKKNKTGSIVSSIEEESRKRRRDLAQVKKRGKEKHHKQKKDVKEKSRSRGKDLEIPARHKRRKSDEKEKYSHKKSKPSSSRHSHSKSLKRDISRKSRSRSPKREMKVRSSRKSLSKDNERSSGRRERKRRKHTSSERKHPRSDPRETVTKEKKGKTLKSEKLQTVAEKYWEGDDGSSISSLSLTESGLAPGKIKDRNYRRISSASFVSTPESGELLPSEEDDGDCSDNTPYEPYDEDARDGGASTKFRRDITSGSDISDEPYSPTKGLSLHEPLSDAESGELCEQSVNISKL